MNIRPPRLDTDCQGIADVVNAFETAPIPLDMVQQWFEQTAPGRITQRRVAVNDQDQVIGYSVVAHETWSPDHHFYLWVGVDPQWRGTALAQVTGSRVPCANLARRIGRKDWVNHKTLTMSRTSRTLHSTV